MMMTGGDPEPGHKHHVGFQWLDTLQGHGVLGSGPDLIRP